ncbi:MAG: hypothetical protein ACLR8Y_12800 [Alistipes indistinctus]
MADDLNGLVNSDLLTNLCPAPDPSRNFDWVKPGRVLAVVEQRGPEV